MKSSLIAPTDRAHSRIISNRRIWSKQHEEILQILTVKAQDGEARPKRSIKPGGTDDDVQRIFLAVVESATLSCKSGDTLIHDIDIFLGQSLLFSAAML